MTVRASSAHGMRSTEKELIGFPYHEMLFGSNAATSTKLNQRSVLAKASSLWGGNKSERLQVSMCLPNNRDLDTWYDVVGNYMDLYCLCDSSLRPLMLCSFGLCMVVDSRCLVFAGFGRHRWFS